jgi:hypothetical protein
MQNKAKRASESVVNMAYIPGIYQMFFTQKQNQQILTKALVFH